MTRPCKCGNLARWFYKDAWTCDPCYRAAAFAPGHYKPGAGSSHFLGAGCEECTAHHVMGMTLEQVEARYRQGHVSQDMYEAFCHVWATSAYRYGAYAGWEKPPVIPEVIRLAEVLRLIGAAMVAAREGARP